MSLGIHFTEDIAGRLAALARANARAMEWARQFGADPRDVAIVEAAYQAALGDVGVGFGLARPALLTILGKEVTSYACRRSSCSVESDEF